jgi:hypothetical protein
VTRVASDTIREDAGMLRLDYRFNNNNTAFFRYNVDNAYIDSPTDALGGHNVVPHIPTNVVLQYQRIISPQTVNEAKFGINRANYHNFGYGTSPVAVSPGTFDGVSDTSLDTEVGTSFSWIDNVTLARGRHTFKFGVEVRRIRLNNSDNTLTTSSISYASNDDFIHNIADSATYLQGEGVAGRHTLAAGYAQDEFRISPNLTLNLGLRYEYYSVVHEILNRSAVVDIAGCGGFCPKGTPCYDPNTKNFGPRVATRTTISATPPRAPLHAIRCPPRTSRISRIRLWRFSIRPTSSSAPRRSIVTERICRMRAGISCSNINCRETGWSRPATPVLKDIICSTGTPSIGSIR